MDTHLKKISRVNNLILGTILALTQLLVPIGAFAQEADSIGNSSITIQKNAISDSDQSFHFSTTGLSTDATGFDLVDDNTAGIPSMVFSELEAGSYTISEAPTDGWDFDSISCSQGSSVSKDGATVTINLAEAEDVTCKYTNREAEKLPVIQEYKLEEVEEDEEDEEFLGSVYVTKYNDTEDTENSEDFDLTITGTGNIEDNTKSIEIGETIKFEVGEGTYDVTEESEEGWVETYNNCKQLLISPNQPELSCSIRNRQKATLIIEKQSSPNDPVAFTFTSQHFEDFQLDDNNDSPLPSEKLFDDITPGTYTFTELPVEGWVLDDIDCNGIDEENWRRIPDTNTLEITIHAGNEIDCTFENDGPGGGGGNDSARLHGYKFNDVNGDSEWNEDEPGIEGWTINLYKNTCESSEIAGRTTYVELDFLAGTKSDCINELIDTTKTDQNGKYDFTVYSPGYYEICEEIVDGWTQTTPSDDSCHELTIYEVGTYSEYNFGNQKNPPAPTPTPEPGHVLGASTETLANTGSSLSQSLMFGAIILSAVAGISLATRKQKI